MPVGTISQVLEHLRRTIASTDAVSDGDLLRQFMDCRDQGAFELLIERHGSMVMGVCLRILGNGHDAEDAFQATFLVLVRKASSLRGRDTVGNWLHGVAYHVALKARAAAFRRREQEKRAMRPPPNQSDECWQELQSLLDRELQRLPEKYRAPVVLCDLEGKTQKEAAAELGCPEGTLSGRLFRARALLAKRLSRHGHVVSASVLAALFAHAATASASVTPSLVTATVEAAAVAAGQVTGAGIISAKVAALTDEAIRGMFLVKLKFTGAVASCVFLVAIGIGTFGPGIAATAPNLDHVVVEVQNHERHLASQTKSVANNPAPKNAVNTDQNEQTGQHEDHGKAGRENRGQNTEQIGDHQDR